MPSLQRNCRITGEIFELTEWEQEFCKKMKVPFPSLSPKERQRRRLAQRNERALYKRDCDLCKKTMIAIYPAEALFPVYCSDCWWSDAWDGSTYGQAYDLTRPFFEQFKALLFKVPRVGMLNRNSVNSEYTNLEANSKNCYLCFAGGFAEDCMYCYLEIYSKDCLDCSLIEKSELCYESIDLENCYQCFYLQDSQNCSDCVLGTDLVGCSDCFGCKGLRNKQYYIFNKAHTKQDYERIRAELFPKVQSPEVLQHFEALCRQVPSKYSHILNSENCSGDYILQSQNCNACFDIRRVRDAHTVCLGQDFNDVYDSDVIYIGVENTYNSHSICLNCSFIRCCNFSWNISFSDYCDSCHYSKNLFGCVGLKHKEYSILNKAYSKTEYEALAQKIIEQMQTAGEWGEFFPYSVFAYNETAAQEHLPLDKEKAKEFGYLWREPKETPFPSATDVQTCSQCAKAFKMVPKELVFYARFGLPVPLKCHECRHKARMAKRNPRQLGQRNCDKCGTGMQSSYAPDRPEIVYCEKCYLESVY